MGKEKKRWLFWGVGEGGKGGREVGVVKGKRGKGEKDKKKEKERKKGLDRFLFARYAKKN